MSEKLPNFINDERQFTTDSRLKCFVMMPFGKKDEYERGEDESNFVFNYIICNAIKEIEKRENTSIEVIREADKKNAGNINKSILKNIASADICIVDITGLNPNVFFELGIRYSLKLKTTILLKQDPTVIPFDIQGYKCITYDCFKPDIAVKSIVDSLASSLSDTTGSVDSLVFETFSNMEVNIPGVLHSCILPPNINNTMPWSEWWARIDQMADLLRDAFENGRFVPTVVLGISNGGLMVADALGRKVFRSIPILSFYANRWGRVKPDTDPACYYFDNPFNRAIMQQIKTYDRRGRVTVLLIDDIVFSSTTIFQAMNFLKEQLRDSFDILFTPMYCRDPDRLKTIAEVLPMGFKHGSVFGVTEGEYYKRLYTSRSYLPYEKAIGKD